MPLFMVGNFPNLTSGSMQIKLKRLSQQAEIFQRLRMIIFKGNLKVNLPLTFKGNHNAQGSSSRLARMSQNKNRNHRQIPSQINFRPHPPRPEPVQSRSLPFSFVPQRQGYSPFRPNLNEFIISQSPGTQCKNPSK